jgi:type I restriction enzyme S subunit
VFYLDEDYWPLNTSLYVTDFKGSDPRFVAYFLRHVLHAYQSDKAAVPGVDRNVLHEIDVRFPDRELQANVAEVLGAYDDLIENNRRRMGLLEDAARQLYREWFVRLRFPGHAHTRVSNGLPKGWEQRPLSTCARFLSGGTPAKSRPDFWEGSIPWVSSGELTRMRISDTTLKITQEAAEAGSRLVPAGTILGVVRGMSLAKEFRIGITARPMAFNQDLKAIVASPGVDTFLLYHTLDAQRDQIRDKAGEASHGTKKLESAVLSDVQVIVPTRPVQDDFRRRIAPLHAQWDVLDRQISQLRSARDLLLPRLMSGEIAV